MKWKLNLENWNWNWSRKCTKSNHLVIWRQINSQSCYKNSPIKLQRAFTGRSPNFIFTFSGTQLLAAHVIFLSKLHDSGPICKSSRADGLMSKLYSIQLEPSCHAVWWNLLSRVWADQPCPSQTGARAWTKLGRAPAGQENQNAPCSACAR